ncbi:MAG TPA: hypothetical protein VGE67_13650, partial [Haloferula sp.]
MKSIAAILLTLAFLTGCATSPPTSSSRSGLPEPYPDQEHPRLESQTYLRGEGIPDAEETHHIFFAAYSRSRVKMLGG